MAGHTGATSRAQSEYGDLCAVYPHDGLAIRGVLDRIGDKWSLLAMVALESGPRRHGQLKRDVVGVSQRMLTLTLRQLERDGLVSRTVYPEIPPRVEYALTDLGGTLIGSARDLVHWALVNHEEIARARAAFDAASASDIEAPSEK